MRRYVVLFLLAACSKPPADPAAPGTSFGYRQPSDGTVSDAAGLGAEEGVVFRGSADGMPISLRSKFIPHSGEFYVSWVVADQALDSVLVEIGREDIQVLDEEMAAMVSYGTLHAGAELDGGLFSLRRTADGHYEDILAAWIPGAGRLIWITDLAWTSKGGEVSEYHDAWLTDLDGDGRLDIVQRSTTILGQVEEVTWAAYTISATLALAEIKLPVSQRSRLASMKPSYSTVAPAGS